MSPLIPALCAAFMIELGGTSGLYARRLSEQCAPMSRIFQPLGLAAAGTMLLAALGALGLSRGETINAHVAMLMLGMALIWTASQQFRALKTTPQVLGARRFIIALRGFVRLSLASTTGFLVFVIALYGGGDVAAAFFAALGGWLGIMVACFGSLLLSRHRIYKLQILAIRTVGGIIFAVSGFFFSLGALRLI